MKLFRFAMMAVVMLALSGVARAFTFTVLDPAPTSPEPPTAVYIDPGVPFTLNFGACPANYVSKYGATGCAEAKNESNVTITSIDLNFSGAGVTLDGCASDSFQADCYLDPTTGDYILNFSGCADPTHCGILAGSDIWFLEDLTDSSDPGSFPTTNGIASATPEPSSIWLALTGMSSLGYVVRRRFRAVGA